MTEGMNSVCDHLIATVMTLANMMRQNVTVTVNILNRLHQDKSR